MLFSSLRKATKIIQELGKKFNLTLLLDVLKLSRSTYYYQVK